VDLPKMDYSTTGALKELSYRTFGRDREEVEAEIRRKFATPIKPDVPAPVYQ